MRDSLGEARYCRVGGADGIPRPIRNTCHGHRAARKSVEFEASIRPTAGHRFPKAAENVPSPSKTAPMPLGALGPSVNLPVESRKHNLPLGTSPSGRRAVALAVLRTVHLAE